MADALDAFMETAQRIVYCSLATVDRRGRPRDGDRLVGWAECEVTWIQDDAGRQDAWERLSAAAEPMGYDPAPIWLDGLDGDDFVPKGSDPFLRVVEG